MFCVTTVHQRLLNCAEILFSFFISCSACAEPADYPRIRAAAISLRLELGVLKGYELAKSLRSLVHQRRTTDKTLAPQSTVELADADVAFSKAVVTQERFNACNGIGVNYLQALRAIEFQRAAFFCIQGSSTVLM